MNSKQMKGDVLQKAEVFTRDFKKLKEDERFTFAFKMLDDETADLYISLSYSLKVKILNTWRLYLRLFNQFGDTPTKWIDIVKMSGYSHAIASRRKLHLQASRLLKRVPPKQVFLGSLEKFIYGAGHYRLRSMTDVEVVRELVENA